jgi:DNA-binding response OmpR family regulator
MNEIGEVLMPLAIVLAVDVDYDLIGTKPSTWQSSGFFVTSVRSIGEALDHFKVGDFDLVLLGGSIPNRNRPL